MAGANKNWGAMKLSTRYALVGIGGLATLSLVHWARGLPYGGSPLYLYLLGALPNLAAAVAMPFVALGIWTNQNANAAGSAARRWFAGAVAVSGAGLIVWEVMQRGSRNLVFDLHDIGATILGLLLAVLLFVLVTPRQKYG